MNNTLSPFEIVPFSLDADMEEIGRRSSGGSRSFPQGRRGPSRMLGSTQSRLRRGPHRPLRGYGPGVWAPPPEGGLAPASGAVPSEQIRWVQFMLNSALGANLPVDGLVSSDLRAALRDFQRRQGLPVSGFVGPDTIDPLKQTSGSEPSGELAGEEFDISDQMARSLDERLKRSSLHLTRRIVNTVPEVRGLYRITWPGGSYYGRSEKNLRERLRDHITEVEQLGFSVSQTHLFTYAQMPRHERADVKIAEKKVTALHFNDPGNTNKRIGELEFLSFS